DDPGELAREAALADPGLAVDREEMGAAVAQGALVGVLQQLQLVLAARFTASPVAKVASPSSVTTSPDSTPTRACIESSSTASRIPRPARTARSASSSWACGMPNAAMTASPANFSTIPP